MTGWDRSCDTVESRFGSILTCRNKNSNITFRWFWSQPKLHFQNFAQQLPAASVWRSLYRLVVQSSKLAVHSGSIRRMKDSKNYIQRAEANLPNIFKCSKKSLQGGCSKFKAGSSTSQLAPPLLRDQTERYPKDNWTQYKLTRSVEFGLS